MSSHQWKGQEDDIIDLKKGHPNPRFLPVQNVNDAFTAAMTQGESSTSLLKYGRSQGNVPMCEAVCELLRSKAKRKKVSPAEILITNGSGPGLSLVCHLFAKESDTVFCDSPTYFLAFNSFRDARLNVVEIPVDENGINVDIIEEHLRAGKRPVMVYTVPIAHNPTGVTLSNSRRERLAELSREFNFKILADEVYQLLEFGETPSVGLFDLDDPKNPTVFAINSFSKILAPGLRLGWIETNVKHMQRILECGPLTSGGGFNPITSGMAYQLLKSGFISDHIDLLRGKYAETCSILCRSLDTHLRAALSPGEELKYHAPAGGFFCFVTLPERIDTNRLQDIALAKHGVTFFPGNVSSEKKDKFLNCLRLCFAFVDSEKIEQGVMRLADAIRGYV